MSQSDIQNLLQQNRLLTEEVKRRIDQIGAINIVAATVSQSLDLDVTLKTALRAVLDVVGAEAGGISLLDEASKEVVLRAQEGWPHDWVTQPMRIPYGQGMSGQVITRDEVVVDNDFDGTEALAVPQFHNENFRAIAMAPMHARNQIIGILSIMSNQRNAFSAENIAVLKSVADTVGVALDNARLYETTAEQEERLHAIYQATSEGIIATDLHGRISLINHAAATIFDVDAERLIGTPLRESPIHRRVRDSLLHALSDNNNDKKSFQVNLDKRLLSIVVSSIVIESSIDQARHNDGWVIVVQDITHFRDADVQKSEFIRTAAHDMKNPLGVALGSLNMLNDFVGADDPTAQELIQLGLNGISRLQDLINDLLHLEQIEHGYGASMTTFKVGDLMEEAVKDIKPLLAEKNLTCVVEAADSLPQLTADRRWVKRAFMNYLDNATKYTEAGDVITARAYGSSTMLYIEVNDNGPGIPVEAQSRLFERFYRASDDRIKGTGLGLAIVKSVAEKHGGGVYVQSQQGKGRTFGMTLSWGTPPPINPTSAG